MTDLKTLEDFEFDSLGTSYGTISRALRREALEWIKVIDKKIETIRDLESKLQSPLQKAATSGLDEVLEGQKKIFTDFFNLTEEKLDDTKA